MDIKDIKVSDHLYQLAVPEKQRDRDKDRHMLERFLKVFGLQFDKIKDKIDQLPTLIDIDRVPDEWLPNYAYLIGYPYNPERPAITQRIEMKLQIPNDRIKGTIPAIRNIIKGLDPNVQIVDMYPLMARYSVNFTFSGIEKYQDGTYVSTGVFEIITNADLSQVRDLIAKQRPAGTRLWYRNTGDLIFDNDNEFQNKYRAKVHGEKTHIYLGLEEANYDQFSGYSSGERGRFSGPTWATENYHIRTNYLGDARRKIIGSRLYTFEEILRVYPNATVDSPLDLLKPVERHFNYPIEAAYTRDYMKVKDTDRKQGIALEVDYSHTRQSYGVQIAYQLPRQSYGVTVAAVSEIIRVLQLSVPIYRHELSGTSHTLTLSLAGATFTPAGMVNTVKGVTTSLNSQRQTSTSHLVHGTTTNVKSGKAITFGTPVMLNQKEGITLVKGTRPA